MSKTLICSNADCRDRLDEADTFQFICEKVMVTATGQVRRFEYFKASEFKCIHCYNDAEWKHDAY